MDTTSFTPTLDPPDRFPKERFSLEISDECRINDCRHGLMLILNRMQRHVLVWDPVTGDVTRVAFPPRFNSTEGPFVTHGAVLRADSNVPEGRQHSIPFLVALVAEREGGTRVFACLYSSITGLWGDIISTASTSGTAMLNPSALVGGSLYWMFGVHSMAILEFDLEKQGLAVIDVPPTIDSFGFCRHWVMPTEDGSLGFLCLLDFTAELWLRKKGSDGVARWVLGKTVELDKFLSLDTAETFPPLALGYAEEDYAALLATADGVFVVQLESMQFKKPFKLSGIGIYYVFSSVYTAGLGIDNEHGGPQQLDNA